MLLRTIALGALAYVGYKAVKSAQSAEKPEHRPSDLRLAGGPLSDQAKVQSSDVLPPA